MSFLYYYYFRIMSESTDYRPKIFHSSGALMGTEEVFPEPNVPYKSQFDHHLCCQDAQPKLSYQGTLLLLLLFIITVCHTPLFIHIFLFLAFGVCQWGFLSFSFLVPFCPLSWERYSTVLSFSCCFFSLSFFLSSFLLLVSLKSLPQRREEKIRKPSPPPHKLTQRHHLPLISFIIYNKYNI
jgi:hypothetical protein